MPPAEDIVPPDAARLLWHRVGRDVRLHLLIRERLQARGVPPTDPLWVAAHRAHDASHCLMIHLMYIAHGNRAAGNTAGPPSTTHPATPGATSAPPTGVRPGSPSDGPAAPS